MFEEEFFRLIHTREFKKMQEFQQKIAAHVDRAYHEVKKLYGADVAYKGSKAVAAVVSEDSEAYKVKEVRFPYVSTYFAFRELPVLWDLLQDCDGCVIFDGHGQLHPRRAGLATMAGVMLGKQTIGTAKALICGEVRERYVYEGDEVIGKVLTVENAENPLYVSIGNKVTLEQAYSIVSENCVHRTPELVRKAHIVATQIAKRI